MSGDFFDRFFDDPFHACALRAWFDVVEATGQWPPDAEATRRRAYQLYESLMREQGDRVTVATDAPAT